jgi:hypothetical protein
MENALPDTEQKRLRAAGTITENEIALQLGDLIVAENVVSRERRVIQPTNRVQEGRRVLKD